MLGVRLAPVPRTPRSDLADRALSYDTVGVTEPGAADWHPAASGFRTFEASRRVGSSADWSAVADDVLRWRVKTGSGFSVDPAAEVQTDASYWLRAHIGPVTVREPVRVVAVVREPTRCGFAYGTLAGHPVSGEEAFVVHRADDGVYLTLRSVTRPGAGIWRLAFPAVLVAQRVYRRRYLEALQR